jgi:hypothetical protein
LVKKSWFGDTCSATKIRGDRLRKRASAKGIGNNTILRLVLLKDAAIVIPVDVAGGTSELCACGI